MSPPPAPSFDPSYDHLIPTGVIQAWTDGSPDGGVTLLQGQGVKVGIVDSGAQSTLPALAGRITWYQNYVGTDTSTQDAYGHGTLVTAEIGGVPVAQGAYGLPFRGGVAPAASLYVARALSDQGNGSDPDFVQAINDMAALGVRLFNVSAGSSTSITQAVTRQTTEGNTSLVWEARAYHTLIDKDALIVWAAGNFGDADVSQNAGLPYVAPQYAHHWLAVVNVALNSSGQPNGLDTGVSSTACGVAASWCLAAPGLFYGVPVPGTSFPDGVSEGTSNAAPIVTGVAALVWQKFPWMSASNVQEVLLGTATSLGDPALYGYGMVNADKAVKGPALLDWGTFEVNVPAGTSAIFANDLSGAGSLLVANAGTGALVLSGQDRYTGGTVVQSGLLQVNGTLASAVTVGSGGVLGGSGVVSGSVSSAAHGAVSTQYGALRIQGNYLASASALTIVRAGTPLTVTGSATVAGSTLSVDVPSGYVAKSVEPMIQANGGLNGTFGALTVLGGVYVSGTLSYTSTEAEVSLSRTPAVAIAAAAAPVTAVAIHQAAAHIDHALTVADGWASNATPGHEGFLAAAVQFQQAPTLAAAAASIDSLSGQIHASTQALTLEQGQIINRSFADRFAQGMDEAGAWMQLIGSNGEIGRSGFASGKFDGGGAVLGADLLLSERFTAGAAFDWDTMHASYGGMTGSGKSNTIGASLYGRYDVGALYVAGRLGQDWVSSHVNRYALLGESSQTIASDRDDRLGVAYLESGYRVVLGGGTLTPFMATSYDHLRSGAFAESGAGGWGLMVTAQSHDQLDGQLGLRFSMEWDGRAGHSGLTAYALWQSVLSGLDTSLRASFVGVPAATFAVSGVQVPRNAGWFGIGWSTRADHGWSWFLNADGQVSGGPTRSLSLTAGVRRAW
ncbi:autotransporter domain-containing protein [Dyella telluris]|uniref:Autotransporter domain-containing protein n=1 Tax=Dyella telluris TaxID=2763498 RepID=A0A7G8Q006_9GAMM|nr:autotransporter domain-containing protein [Dyella telluris]QNK00114.1 autotransporter domain-containing protein [Dyella telluris]